MELGSAHNSTFTNSPQPGDEFYYSSDYEEYTESGIEKRSREPQESLASMSSVSQAPKTKTIQMNRAPKSDRR